MSVSVLTVVGVLVGVFLMIVIINFIVFKVRAPPLLGTTEKRTLKPHARWRLLHQFRNSDNQGNRSEKDQTTQENDNVETLTRNHFRTTTPTTGTHHFRELNQEITLNSTSLADESDGNAERLRKRIGDIHG